MGIYLSSLVSDISHIGKTVASQLKHLGVLTAEDLLFYFPSRYDDLSKITLIKDAPVSARVVLRGRIELIKSGRSKFRRKSVTHAVVSDSTGAIRAIWFNQPWIAKMFKEGDEVYLVGEVKDEGSGAYLSSPVYEKAARNHAATHVARIVPVYPATEKLSQKQIRFLVQRVLPLARQVHDPLSSEIRARYKLLSLPQALMDVHFPVHQVRLEAARRRLKFDELLRLQLFAVSLKRELKKIPAPTVLFKEDETKKFVDSLPFKLTNNQRKSAWEILQDMARPRPMNRLLEGDVGSGKTVVVAIAALNCVLGGVAPPPSSSPTRGEETIEKNPLRMGEEKIAISPPSVGGVRGGGERGQVAIMTPTEILARQHYKMFTKFLEPQGITVELRTGSEKKSKSEVNADVVVGTHALIQGGVKFRNLVLAVIDEQHRFGVSQRQALKEKRTDGALPHLLTLTATPIPRSLALVFYGDLDISVLREMPKGRQRIETRIIGTNELTNAYEFVRDEVAAGHQVFWTCPIIDPSDTLGVKAATEVFEHLKKEVFTDLKIGLLHGRLKSKEREKAMEEFLNREIDILVATPVIEVGIDVPNATVMVIEGSERFGLAQLHQFRGRVGRGEAQSYCLLIVDKLSPPLTPPLAGGERLVSSPLGGEVRRGQARIQAFLESNNGFELAERDLALRGPGEMYGMTQSGFPEFKIASFADVEIAKEAKEAAQTLLDQDPELARYPGLKAAVLEKEGKAHLE